MAVFGLATTLPGPKALSRYEATPWVADLGSKTQDTGMWREAKVYVQYPESGRRPYALTTRVSAMMSCSACLFVVQPAIMKPMNTVRADTILPK